MRMDSFGTSTLPNSRFSATSASCCWMAAAQAMLAWSGTSSGVFQNARIPSPRISVTTPPKASMMFVISVRYRVRRYSRSGSGRASAMVVKFLMSENMTVTSRRRTWSSRHFSFPRTMFFTTDSGTKRANALTLIASRQKASCKWLTSLIRARCPDSRDKNSGVCWLKSSLSSWLISATRLQSSREIIVLRQRPMTTPTTTITTNMRPLKYLSSLKVVSKLVEMRRNKSSTCSADSFRALRKAPAGKTMTTSQLV
mmetsp:Transcript_70934/g.125394  ORF Transcript_70934/g.125394 Transcript_70934/m.125394 type:complete len:255 (+) Transcript_70934:544-1308(+)